MKTNPHVSIYHWKALCIRIPSQRFIFIFVKGLLYKIHIYVNSVQRPFQLQITLIYQLLGFSCCAIGKFQGCIRNQRQFAIHYNFQLKWSPECLFWQILCVLNDLKSFCMVASAMKTVRPFTFPIVWVSGAAQLENTQHATGIQCILQFFHTK